MLFLNLKKINAISLLFALLIIAPVSLHSQQKYFMGKNSYDDVIKVGVKLGVNLAQMAYSDERIADINQQFKIKPLLGITAEIPLIKAISISPEILFVGKGTAAEYVNDEGYTENYAIKSNYIDLRVPILFNIAVKKVNRLYFYVAPDISYAITGKIGVYSSDPDESYREVAVNKNNTSMLDFSVSGGFGCRFNIKMTRDFSLVARIEAGYNFGLLDTYPKETAVGTPDPFNINSFDIQGVRSNRGIEAAIVLCVPLKKSDAFCK